VIETRTPATPAKEYVNASGRLIATEESSQGSGSGNAAAVFDFEPDQKTELGFHRNGLWGVLKSAQKSARRGQPNMTLRFTIQNENMITLL